MSDQVFCKRMLQGKLVEKAEPITNLPVGE